MKHNSLDSIFSPSSIAVIGASATIGKVGHSVFYNILHGGYTGTLYPVNSKANSVLSVKSYNSILEIPDLIDLAVIILSPTESLKAVKECSQKGVNGIVIISAGFKEVGQKGREIENEIINICRENNIRLVGPNCLGVINPSPEVKMNASFSARMPNHGNISFISQSGALCTAVLDFAAYRGFGFSKFISIGNKADVDELDLLEYYHQDPDTDVIMIYMEELGSRGREFINIVKEITSGEKPTPVLVIKSGRSAAGASAAASHTGSLAGSDAVYDALFRQAGVIRCDSVNTLFDFATAFASKKMPKGNRVAIITNAGGPGIIATDMTESSGLTLAEFSEATVDELRKYLPSTANFYNPVDLIGDAPKARYENALSTVISDSGVDGILIILTPQSMTDAIGTAEAIVKIARTAQKPIVCSFMGVIDVSEGVCILQKNNVPVYTFPENAAAALGQMHEATRWLNRKRLPQYHIDYQKKRADIILEKHIGKNKVILNEIEGNELLSCYGFETLPMGLAKSSEEAVKLCRTIQYPVVMKVVSEDILHKSDVGGVIVDIKTDKEAIDAFHKILGNAALKLPDAKIEGVLVQKMSSKGEEVILGANRYPGFGHLIMFGLGGIYVEVFKDVAFRLTPLGRNDARRMVKSIKGYQMLSGYRGRGRVDIEKIEKLLVRLSAMVTNHPEIKELDINPLIVHEKGKGATVADVVVTLAKPASGFNQEDHAEKFREGE